MPTEWDAAAYDAVAALQRHVAEEALGALVLRGDETVLDVGCGDGRVTAELAARLPAGHVLGVDPSTHMIAWAQSHVARANCDFVVGDARALHWDGAFDLVVSFNALHWVPEQDVVLRGVRRALRPSGCAVVQQVPAGDRPSLEQMIERTCQRPRWRPAFAGHRVPYLHVDVGAYRTLARDAGLDVVDLVVRDVRWDFGARAAFERFAEATFVAWASVLPADARDAFVTDVLDAYARSLHDPADAAAFRFWQMRATLSPA
jgi:trans-aconitate 2-methyltransferase